MNLTGLWGVALFLAPGAALTALLPALRRRHAGERLGFAYLLGVAFLAGGLYAASHVLHLPIRRTTILGLAALPLVAAAAVARGGGGAPRARAIRSRWVLVPLAVGGLGSVGLLADAVTNPVLDWDGRMIWGAHARAVRAERTVDAMTLRSPRYFVAHPRYPLLMPLAQVAVEETLDSGEDDRVVRPLYAAIFPAFLLVLFGAIRRVAGVRASALGTAAAALLPFLGPTVHGGALGQCSDFALAGFLGGALALLTAPRALGSGPAAGLLLSAAILTKQEGLPLACVVLAAAALHAMPMNSRRFGPLATGALLAAAATGLLVHWRQAIVNRQDENYTLALVPVVRGLEERSGSLAHLVAREMADTGSWGMFWFIAPPIALLGFAGLRRRRMRAYLLFVPAAMAIYLAAYAVTAWRLDAIVSTTWNRFLVQTSFAWLVLFASALSAALVPEGSPLRLRVPRWAWRASAPLLLVTGGLLLRAHPGWFRAPASATKEAPELLGAVDEPGEGVVVKGPLLVRGWARMPDEDLAVTVLVDGEEREPLSLRRTPRPDVLKVFPEMGDVSAAGYEARFTFQPGDEGAHELVAVFHAKDGRLRHFPLRRFVWKP